MIYALDANFIFEYLRMNPTVRRNFDNAVERGDTFVIPVYINYEVMRGFRHVPASRKKDVYMARLIKKPLLKNMATFPPKSKTAAQIYCSNWNKHIFTA